MSNRCFSLIFLKKMIEEKKGELIGIGMSKGLNHEDTIRISQELDYFIFLYQHRVVKKRTKRKYFVS